MTEISFTSKKENKKAKNKEVSKPNFWTEEEDKILKEKAEEYNFKNWNSIANFIPGRTSIQCSARYRRIRPGLIKGAWDKEEDNKLLSLYEKYGKNWAAISKEMPHRTGKQIRDRFLNSLDSKFERGKFNEEEDQAIIKYYKIYGNSWAKIAKKLKTRTGDMVKNRFYSSLKKTIFKKSFLKKKRERAAHKNKNKIEEENIIEEKNKINLMKPDSTIINQEKKEQKEKIVLKEKKEQKKKKELKDQNEKKYKKEKVEKNEKKVQKEISNILDVIKNSNEENEEISNQKNKANNNINSTNNISYESNNSSVDIENKNNNKNNSLNTSVDLNENLNQKQLLNNSENENKFVNDNNIDFNLDDNIKKNEISNSLDFNELFRFNSDLFIGLKDNANDFITLNQKDEIDEKLEKLKNFSKVDLEYKQNLKEQLDIIYDLENIINQKLSSVQKEIENN